MTRKTLAGAVTILLVAGAAFAQTPPPQTPPVVPKPAAPAVPLPFPADSKFGFINLKTVFALSQLGKAGQKTLQVLADKNAADLAAKNKAIQSLTQEIQQQSGVLSAAALTTKNGDLDRLQREYQFAQQTAQADSDAMRQQILAGFEEKVVPVIAALAKETGLYAVWDVQNSGAAYVYPGLDLSAEVIKRLDAKEPGTGKL